MAEKTVKRARILIVDDEPQALQIMTYRLSKDFEVFTASNAEEGFYLAFNEHMDAALVDYTMPGETGTILLRKLRDLAPYCLRVLVTANQNPAIAEEAIREGQIHRFLRKPLNYDALVSELNELLFSRDAASEIAAREHFLASDYIPGLFLADLRNAEQILGTLDSSDIDPISKYRQLQQALYQCFSQTRAELLKTLEAGAPSMSMTQQNVMLVVKEVASQFKNVSLMFLSPNDIAVHFSEPYLRRALSGILYAMLSTFKERQIEINVHQNGSLIMLELNGNDCDGDILIVRLKAYNDNKGDFSEEKIVYNHASLILNAHGSYIRLRPIKHGAVVAISLNATVSSAPTNP